MVDLISDFTTSINKENCEFGGAFYLKNTKTKMLIKIKSQ